jgi:hypothetical protein
MENKKEIQKQMIDLYYHQRSLKMEEPSSIPYNGQRANDGDADPRR